MRALVAGACLWALGAQAVEPAPFTPPGEVPFEVRPFARLSGRWGVDMQLEPADAPLAENVSELWLRAALGADVKLSPSLRFVAEGRLLWRGSTRRGWVHAKATEELDVGELFLDVYSPRVDLRVGQQTFAFGANAAFAPTDVLNPRDLRDSFLFAELEDTKLPTLGVRALVDVASFTVTLAYVPFFRPHRYDVVGHDLALLQPGLGAGATLALDPSIEDLLQPHLLETSRPRALGWLGDVGVRVTRPVGAWKLGASWVWFYEKLPQVTLDPELRSALEREAAGLPPEPAVALSLQNRFRAGEVLFRGEYQRQHVVALEASRLLGNLQLDVDLGYSPAQTFVDAALVPRRKATASWVLGLSPAEDSRWIYALSYVGLAAFGVDSGERLLLVEPASAGGSNRTVSLHLLAGTFGVRLVDETLELSVRGAVELRQGSFVVAPSVAYELVSGLWLWLAAEVQDGVPLSPFGYFRRNDQLLVGARWLAW